MSQQTTALAVLQENLPTIEALIKLNAGNGVSVGEIRTRALEEIAHFELLLLLKPEIEQCEKQSILLAIRQVVKKNLSLDPSQGLVYTMIGSVKNKQGNYVKILEVPETANGKISVARQCGRILDIKRPVISYNSSGQCDKIVIEYLVPSVPSPRWEVQEFTENNFKKWKMASHKKNGRGKPIENIKEGGAKEVIDYSNPLYSSWNGGIDPEFAATKSIRHSLTKLGTNINEVNGLKLNLSPMEPIISPDAAAKEVREEVENDKSYTDFEEIPTVPANEVPAPINEIPNAEDL